ncbi:MarR family transcriptional regulator [uncultured Negativibacillus sp.]|uniref:MarR family winged helix-turn-helix transcriptional regulator n=1 Tax=uncultured Negativibacillus sp. TaxID=1980696 RepID=UPI0025ED4927|nr:MarR family transcriptional regulator [uncultured Negativibacillus sp.]
MKPFEEQLNAVIVDTYRSILKVEETILKRSDKIDLSINEMHMLEAVGKGKDRRRTISELAEELNITLPSVTVAINKLMKKGYVEKVRGEEDGRIVYVSLTRMGKKIDSVHRYFHESMVRSIIRDMTEEEQQILYKGVMKLDQFLKDQLK